MQKLESEPNKKKTEILLPTNGPGECIIKEVSTFRKASGQVNGQPKGIFTASIIFGRTLGVMKASGFDLNVFADNTQDQVKHAAPNQPCLKLVRLLFYLPVISNEKDVYFFLDKVGIFNHWRQGS